MWNATHEVMREMRLALRPKPKTLAERAEAAGVDALEFVRSVPERLDTSRKRALAVAGGAVGAAAGLAFWRSRSDDGPSVHSDPAKPATPASNAKKKSAKSTKAAATNAAGSRSK